MPPNIKRRWLFQILLLVVILLAAWLRLWQLAKLPPGFWYDEAYSAMDAIWMLETFTPRIFLPGNTGNEAMFHYLGVVMMAVLGATPYAFRLGGALAGILTLPLMYRWLVTLWHNDPDRHWLALLGTGGLAFSFWHLVMSRSGYRATLFPLFIVLTAYFFWRGRWRQSLPAFIGAGLALGLSQYTYLSARLWPIVFVLFGLIGFIFFRKMSPRLWLGLGVMLLAALLVFSPLGFFYLTYPEALFSRTDQVFIIYEFGYDFEQWFQHLGQAFRVFWDGSDPNWRHNIVGQSGFNGLSLIGFGVGLMVALVRVKQPAYLFLLISLFVLWLPAPLSTPAVHTLRLSGVLPVYYTLMAVGLITLLRLAGQYIMTTRPTLARLIFFLLVLGVNGGAAASDYFGRWANEPSVYQSFDGPQVELTRYLLAQSDKYDILLPFNIYSDPATRLLLYDTFRETTELPLSSPVRPALIVSLIKRVSKIRSNSSSYVWLTRNETGKGIAYISSQPWPPDPAQPISSGSRTLFLDRYTGQPMVELTYLTTAEPVYYLFTTLPSYQPLAYHADANQLRLLGYHFEPNPVSPEHTLLITLYWQLSRDSLNWDRAVTVKLFTNHGELIDQSKFLTKQIFSWRQSEGILTSQHAIYISSDLPEGPVVARIELSRAGRQLSFYTDDGILLGDQPPLGLFYITQERDPRQPSVPLKAHLGDQIELLGYTAPQPLSKTLFRGKVYWQVKDQLALDYTPFIQLYDAQGQLISSWEAQPLGGQYPTSFWRPGETIVDEFDLQVQQNLSSGQYQLVVGMYDPATGARLPASDATGQSLQDDVITLIQGYIP